MRRPIAKSQKVPAALFFAYDEIANSKSPLHRSLFALADRTQGSNLKIVIYGADQTDLGLKEFREM